VARARSTRPSGEALDAWRSWLLAHRRVTHLLDRELREGVGVSLDDYDVLVQLASAPDRRLRMSDLADALLLARSSCTRIVGRLEQRGWLERTPDDRDGRVVWAALLPAGRAVQRRAAVIHLAGVHTHFGRHLAGGDAAVIRALSARMVSGAR
jgi:DNA-binding MarR family transcriptional regulator